MFKLPKWNLIMIQEYYKKIISKFGCNFVSWENFVSKLKFQYIGNQSNKKISLKPRTKFYYDWRTL